MFIITGAAYAEEVTSFKSLPFGLEWGQTEEETNHKLIDHGHILEKDGDTSYYVILPRNGYSSSSHFVFNKSGGLYRIVMLGVCKTVICATGAYVKLRTILENSKYNKIHSEGRLRIYHDPLTKSYIKLISFAYRDDYTVVIEYAQDKVSPLKKYHK